MIKISADSTADLENLFAENDISVMPLNVKLGDECYLDGVDIGPQMIFDRYDEDKTLPKTASRSIEEYRKYFETLTEGGNEVIHFAMSAEMSSSYSNAVVASKDMDGVYVVDSRSLSTGIGLLVMKAVDYAKEGKTAKEIFDLVCALVPKVQASFVVETLEYLHKGGRCSGVARFLAGTFMLKPMILLRDGKMLTGQKYMGRMDKCLLKYVYTVLRENQNPDYSRIFITHTYADPETVDVVKDLIHELAPDFKEVIETHAGCTITSHCGKGTLGILFINN